MKSKNDKENSKTVFTKQFRIRAAIVALLVALAVAAFSYGISQWISADSGYRTVECTANVANCSSEFVFTYELGVSGVNPTVELKAITTLYNDQTVYYYRLFHPIETFDEVVNVASLNRSVNKEIKVPERLYAALEKAVSDPGRNVYLAPIFAYYDTLFSSSYDEDAADWDPSRNKELGEECERMIGYISSDEHISLKLQGENRVTLFVSDEYLAFAEEVGISEFVDFYWMKNAFIADYLADDLVSGGYTHGVISSRDGYIRNFDSSSVEYTFDIFDEQGGTLYAAGKLKYNCDAAICTLHPFVLDEIEGGYYYAYSDGTRVTRYISSEDARPHDASGAVTVYASSVSCADLLISVLPYYIADSLAEYSPPGVGVVYSDGRAIYVTDVQGFTYTPN